jgi:LmbE family N-acetylglucosaminyl deacetylase
MPGVLIIGAHPDDAEVKAAGAAALWTQAGVSVTFVSLTDGSAGHHEVSGPPLAARRRQEAEAAAAVLGVEVEFLDYPDGHLQPTLEARLDVLRLIRRRRPDLVLTHRPNDYHPDHRYTSQLVQDAAYMVTVPSVAPETPHLHSNPVFGYLSDRFRKPIPFEAHVIAPVDAVIDRIVDALDCHASQFYEWLPFNMGILGEVPADAGERKGMLREWYVRQYALRAEAFPGRVGDPEVRLVEAFEISEYGAPLDDAARSQLFPFRTY